MNRRQEVLVAMGLALLTAGAFAACDSETSLGGPNYQPSSGGYASTGDDGGSGGGSGGNGGNSGGSGGNSGGSGGGSGSNGGGSGDDGGGSGDDGGSGSSGCTPNGYPSTDSVASSPSGGTAACGCHGKAGCAIWPNVYISFYGFVDNSCETENEHDCNDIAFPFPEACMNTNVAGAPTTYPNAANITHAIATEGTGTYDDPITAGASADSDPMNPTAANPVHKFESYGGVTLTPGTIIYNPLVQKYYIMEDSCIECGDEFACIISPEDTDDGKVPAGCKPGTNLHVDFWMGPNFADGGAITAALTQAAQACENDSTVGDDWSGGGGSIIVNPPDDLPVRTGPLLSATGTCWTSMQQNPAVCAGP